MAAELIIPTNYTPTKPSTSRPIIPIQMQKPDGTWSDNILYNFDTGASSPTDVPLPLLSAFGYGPNGVGTDSSKRKTVPVKIRIPGFNNNQEMSIPAMIQDKDHYDLFREQSNRYPLMRVYDLMPYMSIIYELKQTTLYPKSLGEPLTAVTDTQGTIIMMPQSGQRTGTPTSAHYWTKGTMLGTKTYSNVWFNINTGDYRFIIPRSFCDKAGFKITSDNISGNGESFATGTFRWDETTPTKLTLSNIKVTARDDDEDFARGGITRCLMGGPHFLSKYKIVIWDLNMAFVPIDGSIVTPPPPTTTEPVDQGVPRSGYDTDMSKWTAVNMRDYPTRGKIIDKNGDNVRVDFQSKENAQLWLDWKRSQPITQ